MHISAFIYWICRKLCTLDIELNLNQSDFDIPLSISAKPTGNSDFDVTNDSEPIERIFT